MKTTTNIYYPTGEVEKLFINSIWRLSESGFPQRTEVILPKGTIEIIFNFSDKITYCNTSLQVTNKLPTVFINGINFKPFELIKKGYQEFLGIQLNSIGPKLLFNLFAKEFNNGIYEGKYICSDLEVLADELSHNLSFHQQVEIILNWITGKVGALNNQCAFDRAAKLLCLKYHNDLTVKKLSKEICLSDRQLRRFSIDWLGMNTEEFILYNKYLMSLHLMHDSKLTLTEVGLKSGYYDQSHFIREFKSYTNLTPKEYRRASKGIPGHIFCSD